jgi:hypothetical protein
VIFGFRTEFYYRGCILGHRSSGLPSCFFFRCKGLLRLLAPYLPTSTRPSLAIKTVLNASPTYFIIKSKFCRISFVPLIFKSHLFPLLILCPFTLVIPFALSPQYFPSNLPLPHLHPQLHPPRPPQRQPPHLLPHLLCLPPLSRPLPLPHSHIVSLALHPPHPPPLPPTQAPSRRTRRCRQASRRRGSPVLLIKTDEGSPCPLRSRSRWLLRLAALIPLHCPPTFAATRSPATVFQRCLAWTTRALYSSLKQLLLLFLPLYRRWLLSVDLARRSPLPPCSRLPTCLSGLCCRCSGAGEDHAGRFQDDLPSSSGCLPRSQRPS